MKLILRSISLAIFATILVTFQALAWSVQAKVDNECDGAHVSASKDNFAGWTETISGTGTFDYDANGNASGTVTAVWTSPGNQPITASDNWSGHKPGNCPTATPVTPSATTPAPTTETPVTPSATTETPVTPSETPVTPSETPITPSATTETPVTPSATTETPVTPSETPVTPSATTPAPSETPVTPTVTATSEPPQTGRSCNGLESWWAAFHKDYIPPKHCKIPETGNPLGDFLSLITSQTWWPGPR